MAVTLTDMKARERSAQVTWDDEVVDFGYYPNRFTMDLVEAVNEAAGKNDLSTVAVMLEGVVSWWDVLDDNGERIPPTASTMGQFPLTFLMAIMDAVGEAQRPPDDRT